MSDATMYSIFGHWFLAFCGAAFAASLSIGLLLLANTVGSLLFRNLRRIYSLAVIAYWLKRLESEGYHTFERAQKDGRAAMKEQQP